MESCKNLIAYAVKKQKTFDYNYYLTKNCPLLSNWRERKVKYLEMAKQGPKQRAEVYKELFESESKNRHVADFLSEFVANVFPNWFVEGKNKKILNKKIF